MLQLGSSLSIVSGEDNSTTNSKRTLIPLLTLPMRELGVALQGV